MFLLKTLKSKLLAMSLISTGAALVVACLVLAGYDYRAFRAEMVTRAQVFAHIVAGNSTAAISFGDENDAAQTLASLRFEPHVVAACVYDRSGKRLAQYFRGESVPLPAPAELAPGAYRFGAARLEVSCPIHLNGQMIGSAYVASDLDALHARTHGYAIVFGSVVLGAMVVALLLAARLARFVTGPVGHLSRTATDVSINRNYAVRAEKAANDELGNLVDCFNGMLDQIQERDRQLTVHRDHLEELVAARTIELSKARDKAEEASRAKSNFLANMSHEIRTPMTAILGYADVLLSPTQTMSDRINSLQVIRRNARHLMDLINDILDISKIEAGQMTVESLSCDPARAVVEVVSMLRPRAIAKELSLTVEFVGGIPAEIKTDPLRLRQVLMNLTSNAIKFTERGEVRLKVSAEDLGSGSRVRFDIMDTGIGITAKQTERLFQPFVQADESMTRKYGGTGLGLVISKRLAGQLGGDLTLRSEPGRGTTFSFWVQGGPLQGVLMRQGLSESMLAIGSHQSDADQIALEGRILLVEDGIDNQHLLTMHLETAGAKVIVAANGRLGIERLRAEPFDLVLMDMQMPVLDGYGATSELRRLGYTLPIIALTAHAMCGDRTKCIDAGCTDYLTKPVDKELLLRTVASYLSKAESNKPVPTALSARLPAVAPVAAPGGATARDAAAPPGSSGVAVRRAVLPRDKDAMAEAMRKAVEGFVSRLPAKVDALLQLRQAGDLEELRRLIHQLKGAGAGFGFPRISETAARAEAAIKAAAGVEAVCAGVEELIGLIRSTAGYDAGQEGHDVPAADGKPGTPGPQKQKEAACPTRNC